MNTLKTFMLMAALTALLVIVGGFIGGEMGMMIAFAFAVVMNFTSYWFSDKIVLAMYRAQPLNRSTHPDIFRMTEELCEQSGLPMPKLYLLPSEQPNAFATGRNPKNAAVAVTDGIVRLLSRNELRGVIAHELAHIKNRDILVGTIAATIAGAISMLAYMGQWALIFGGRERGGGGGHPIVMIAMIILAPLAAMFIQMAISRSREFLADQTGATMANDPMALANALRKLEWAAQRIPLNANPATAHMFIVNPLRGGGGFSKLFSTHPPIAERVSRLERMVYGSIG